MPALETGPNIQDTADVQKAQFDNNAVRAALDVTLIQQTIDNAAGSTNSTDHKLANMKLASAHDIATRATASKTEFDAVYVAEAAAQPAQAVHGHPVV